MKIKETIERECCVSTKDFIKTAAKVGNKTIWICKHCGTCWTHDRRPGDMDAFYHRIKLTDFEYI